MASQQRRDCTTFLPHTPRVVTRFVPGRKETAGVRPFTCEVAAGLRPLQAGDAA